VKCVDTTLGSPITLLDREPFLLDLERWLFTTAGGGCIALIHGETGIGKTALVREFTRRQSGRRVLWGACDDLFTPRSLAPLHDIARQVKGSLLDALHSNASRDVIFSTVLDDLERGTPATVVFEDMQWADEATLDLLKVLGRRIGRTRAMLVMTYRDNETGPTHPLRSVIGDLPREHIRRMALSSLSPQSVAKLARQAGQPPADLHLLTGGNPLLVMEALSAEMTDVPISVSDSVLARARRLLPEAREIAEFVALFPGTTDPRHLSRLVELDELAIEACQSIGVTRHNDGTLVFRHELVRRAMQGSLSETRRHALHARILEVLLTDPGVSAARLAHHADGCANADVVLHYALVAAEQAASNGARHAAAAHYQTAVRYADRLDAGQRADLYDKLAYECHLIGNHARAVDMRTRALEIWRSVGNRVRAGASVRWLSTLAWEGGRRDEAIRFASEGASMPEPDVARAESAPDRVAQTYFERASVALARRQYDEARRHLEEGLEYCASQELAVWRLNLLAVSARIKLDQGDWVGCCDDVEVVLRSPCATVTARIAALTLLAQIRSRRGDPDSESPLQEAQMLAYSLQDADNLNAVAIARSEGAWLSGNCQSVGPILLSGFGQWQAAAAAWKRLGCPYEHATVLALYGGETQKREALVLFEGLGAAPAARAIRKQFRAEGVKRVPRGARSTTQSNQFGLTKREAEVLSLLSKGLRNSAIARALFVSQKTVDHHVSAILGKLGVPSRGAAVVATLGKAVANSH